MTKLQKFFRKQFSRSKTANELEQSQEEYGDLSFAEEFRQLKESADNYGWLPSLLSIASGAFLFLSLFPQLPWWVSAIIGLTLLSLYERLKNISLKWGARLKLTDRGTQLLFVAAALGLGSTFFSVFGTYNAYTLLEKDTKKNVSSSYQHQIDSIRLEYDTQIQEAKADADSFYVQNTVPSGGRRVLRTKATNTYNRLTKTVLDLKKEKKEAIAKLDSEKPGAIKEAVDGMGIYLYILILLSLIVEALIFVIGWWREYYKWRNATERQIVQSQEEYSFTLDGIRQLLTLTDSKPMLQSAPQIPKRIGFATSGTRNSDTHHTHVPTQPCSPEKQGIEDKVCDQCKQPYAPKTAWQRFCSKECRHKFHNFSLKK